MLAVFSLFAFTNACLEFDGKYNWITRDISGTIKDNGKQTCTFGGKLAEQHHFGSCNPGFSAYIDGSFTWGSYSNNGNEGEFRGELSGASFFSSFDLATSKWSTWSCAEFFCFSAVA
ncbi:hypothetical protein V492_03790 [Pseudogymnoascus sp. VKM F-4246]|nr:hypothetical protein V492_03790 [Pseudogymnoascus sp. VKM F-4246]